MNPARGLAAGYHGCPGECEKAKRERLRRKRIDRGGCCCRCREG